MKCNFQKNKTRNLWRELREPGNKLKNKLKVSKMILSLNLKKLNIKNKVSLKKLPNFKKVSIIAKHMRSVGPKLRLIMIHLITPMLMQEHDVLDHKGKGN